MWFLKVLKFSEKKLIGAYISSTIKKEELGLSDISMQFYNSITIFRLFIAFVCIIKCIVQLYPVKLQTHLSIGFVYRWFFLLYIYNSPAYPCCVLVFHSTYSVIFIKGNNSLALRCSSIVNRHQMQYDVHTVPEQHKGTNAIFL